MYAEAYAQSLSILGEPPSADLPNLVIATTSNGSGPTVITRFMVYDVLGQETYTVYGSTGFRALSRALSAGGGADVSVNELFGKANKDMNASVYSLTAVHGGNAPVSWLFDPKVALGDIPSSWLVDDWTPSDFDQAYAVRPNGMRVPALPPGVFESWMAQSNVEAKERAKLDVLVCEALDRLGLDERFKSVLRPEGWGWVDKLQAPVARCVCELFQYGDKQIHEVRRVLPVLRDGSVTPSELCEALERAGREVSAASDMSASGPQNNGG